MNDCETIRYTLGEAEVTNVPDAPDELDVGMSQFGASRNSGTILVAAGGPCPIVVLCRLDEHVGALVHISGENAEQNGNDHIALFAQLLTAAPEFTAQTQVCICFDPTPAPGLSHPVDFTDDDIAAQEQLRLAYVAEVEQNLQELGFNNIARLTQGTGKTVHLNTDEGLVIFTDGEGEFFDPPGDAWFPPNMVHWEPDGGEAGPESSPEEGPG